MNRIKALGIALCLAVLSTLATGLDRSHQVGAQVSNVSFDVPAMGIAFTPIGDNAVTQPTLPNGHPGLTRGEALDLAGKHTEAGIDPRQIAGVQYVARYGIFSDTQLTQRDATGAKVHPFANRASWVVQYFGPGVQIPMDGPRGGPLLYSHAVTVVIDADTGQFMELYIG